MKQNSKPRKVRQKRMKKPVPSNKSLNEKINKIQNQMIETKYHDVAFPATAVNTTGTGAFWSSFCLMVQGDSTETRNANKIYAKHLEIRALLQADVDRVMPSYIRMIVFWDNCPNGSNPVIIGTATSLLDDSGGTIAGYTAYPNLNTNRYTILEDKYYTINPNAVLDYDITTGTTSQLCQKAITIHHKFAAKRVVQYNGPLGTIAELSNNGLFVAWISASSTDAPQVSGSGRLLYADA